MSLFSIHSLPVPIPLCYDTIYYVESPNNEPLNQAMRQIAVDRQPLFENNELQPFPFKLQYLSQAELATDHIRKNLISVFDPELVDESIEDLRLCLDAKTGGTLTARCLPKFNYDDVLEEDRAICSFNAFGDTHPEDALENTTMLARYVAKENFHRVAGISYYDFQEAIEEAKHPRMWQSAPGTIGFIRRPTNPKKVSADIERRRKELSALIDQFTDQDNNLAIDLLAAELEIRQNKGKLKTMLPLVVESGKIFLKISEKEKKEVIFARRDVAKTLYIFFLQQLERAKKNQNESKYLSKKELANHKKELLDIYWLIGGKSSYGTKDIESWLFDNDFANALSSIRRFFKTEFDVNYLRDKFNKCYSIEIMDKDDLGYELYGIALDTTDFDLGRLSVCRTL